MQATDVRSHKERLEALLATHSTEPIDLMLVESVAAWCAARGERNPVDPIAMAVRCGETRRAGILVQTPLRSDRIQSAIDRMIFGDHGDLPQKLENDQALFLSHLVLHELAHLANGWGQEREDDCDRWAFQRLLGNAD
jgi:hypothetical protein